MSKGTEVGQQMTKGLIMTVLWTNNQLQLSHCTASLYIALQLEDKESDEETLLFKDYWTVLTKRIDEQCALSV